jgi:hypothetical protein
LIAGPRLPLDKCAAVWYNVSMKKYNFIVVPNYSGRSTFDNPLSERHVGIAGAWRWAEVLLNANYNCDAVLFQSQGGRKTYRLDNWHKGKIVKA